MTQFQTKSDINSMISKEYGKSRFNTEMWIKSVEFSTEYLQSLDYSTMTPDQIGEVLSGFFSLSASNGKLKALEAQQNRKVYSIDLISGLTCPAADICKGHADYTTGSGKLIKNPEAIYSCYAAATESRYSNVYASRTINTEIIKIAVKYNSLTNLLDKVIPNNAIIRIHSAGDFYNRSYFVQFSDWVESRQDLTVFGYTKVLPYVIAPKPDNFYLVYSFGGIFDSKAMEAKVQSSFVITDIEEKPDHISPDNWLVGCSHAHDPNDYNAILSGKSFGLMLH